MRRSVLLLALPAACLFALAACQKPAEPGAGAGAATQDGQAPAAARQGAGAPNPLAPPERKLRSDAIGYEGFNGSEQAGAVSARFGADAAAVRQAWGGEMKDNDGQRPGAKCHLLYPVRGAVAAQYNFLMSAQGLTGIDVYDTKAVAPGGGRIGMGIDEIKQAYAGQVEELPNASFEGSVFLRVAAPEGKQTQLTFQTDALGKVTNWRIANRGALAPEESCTR